MAVTASAKATKAAREATKATAEILKIIVRYLKGEKELTTTTASEEALEDNIGIDIESSWAATKAAFQIGSGIISLSLLGVTEDWISFTNILELGFSFKLENWD